MNTWRQTTAGLAASLIVAAGSARAATVTIDGSQTYQTIDGFGVNANHRSWNNTELQPVLNALINQGGMTLFHVVFDNCNWETINPNTNSNPNALNWSYYTNVYSSPDFQKLWDIIAYLNQQGITNGVIPDFQGPVALWMGGLTLSPGYEKAYAQMIASALIYARQNQNLQFNQVGPANEEDITYSGINMVGPAQYVSVLDGLAQELDGNGLGDVGFIGPDLATTDTNWLAQMMTDPLVMSKVTHFGLHSYQPNGSGSAEVADFLEQSPYPDTDFWMTEFNVWCPSCQYSLAGTNTWEYAMGTVSYLLGHLANGASAGLVWEGYDSQYTQFDPTTGANEPLHWSYWGLFAVNNINATPKTYSPRKQFYTLAQITRFVRPGAQRIDASGSLGPLTLLAFYQPHTGQLTLTGINPAHASTSLTGTLVSLPAIGSLQLYYTDPSNNLRASTKVKVDGGRFTATLPADCVFTLVSSSGSSGPVSVALTSPAAGAKYTAPATLQIAAVASGAGGAPIASVEFWDGATELGQATEPPYSITWSNVAAGTYVLSVQALDTSGNLGTSRPVHVTVLKAQPPTVSITSPGTGARLTDASVTVKGSAKDKTGVAGVEYRLENADGTNDYQLADGTVAWSAVISNLSPGPNTVSVFAYDSNGNESATVSRTFNYVVVSPLTLSVSGGGSVSPNFNGRDLQAGTAYKVTARAKEGYVFAGWTEDQTNLISTAATLSFKMQPGLTLEADFMPNPFLSVQGNYTGLFLPSVDANTTNSGAFNATLTSQGGLSAKLQLAGTTYALSGLFTAGGSYSRVIPRGGQPPLSVQLDVAMSSPPGITGSISDGVFLADLTAYGVAYGPTNPAPEGGRKFTLVLPGGPDPALQPGGYGFGAVTVDSLGNLNFTGTLGDGSKVTQSTFVSGQGLWPLYVSLNSGKNSLFGWLGFTNAQEIGGLAVWDRLPQPGKLYPQGFTFAEGIPVAGSLYAYTNGTQVLDWSEGEIALAGGSLTGQVVNPLVLGPGNKITGANRLSLTIAAPTGLFQGNVLDPATGKPISFSGVLLQNQGIGYGLFLGGSESGSVLLAPSADPAARGRPKSIRGKPDSVFGALRSGVPQTVPRCD